MVRKWKWYMLTVTPFKIMHLPLNGPSKETDVESEQIEKT